MHTCKHAHTELDDIVELPYYPGIVAQKTPDPGVFVWFSRGRQEGLDAGEPWCHRGGVCHLEASGVPGDESPRGPAGALPLRAGQDRPQR